MKMLIPVCNSRVSPVFDVAKTACVYELYSGGHTKTESIDIAADALDTKFGIIRQFAITHIICGAISNQALILATELNIRVVPSICGDVSKVSCAWLNGSLEDDESFFMPAKLCRKRNRLGIKKSASKQQDGNQTNRCIKNWRTKC